MRRTDHHERLLPSWWVWILLTGFVAMLATAYGAALGATVGWLVAVGSAIVTVVVVWLTAPTVRVDEMGLQVGRALLPVSCIGAVRVVSAEQIRELRGPGSDGRLFVALRSWAARGGVLISVEDPRDPHPAWLVSSRHPERLSAALTATMVP